MVEPGYALTFALVTYLLHSTLLSAAVWLLDRLGVLRSTPVREFAWRAALIGAFLTTALQLGGASAWLTQTPRAVTTLAADQVATASPQDALVLRNVTTPLLDAWERAVEPATSAATRLLSPWLGRIWRALVPVWLLGAALGLLRLMLTAGVVARRLRGLRPAPESLRAELRAISDERQVRMPTLWVSDAWNGPVVLPTGAMVVPEWIEHQLDADQRRALLSHELAHVVRGDARSSLALLVLRAIFWMQPWHALAARRLSVLGEWAADAWAARDRRSAVHLAESLVECAERLVRRPQPPAGVPMATGGPLLQRVERLLEGDPMPLSTVSWPVKAAAIVTLLIALVLLPGVRPDRLGAEVRSGSSRTGVYVDDDGSMKLELKRRGESLIAESTGPFTVLADESDLATLAAGERFDLRERRDGLTHEYHVTANASGQLTRRYARDGEVRAIDGVARAWRADAIARMFRESGHDAAARVERLLAAGGDERVFDELEASASDLARVALLKAYVLSPRARREERERVFTSVARLGSDRDRAEVLLALIAAPGADTALFNQIRDLRSGLNDSEYRRVIEAIAQAEQAAR